MKMGNEILERIMSKNWWIKHKRWVPVDGYSNFTLKVDDKLGSSPETSDGISSAHCSRTSAKS